MKHSLGRLPRALPRYTPIVLPDVGCVAATSRPISAIYANPIYSMLKIVF